MSGLVDRLRRLELRIDAGANETCAEAADRIERLEAALRLFVDLRAQAGAPDPAMVDRIVAQVSLCGCDDTTHLTLDVTEAELAFLQDIAAKSEKASTYGCMPTLNVSTIAAQGEEG